MKKLLSALLLLVMLGALLVSCGGKPEKTTPQGTTPPPTAPVDPEASLWESIATDVKAMEEGLRTFKFQMSDMTDGPYHVKCTEYMQGPDSLENAATDIDRLVFERNDAAKKLLGVTISYTTTADNWAEQASVIKAATRDSSNADAADMFVYTMFDMTMACFDGCFRELSTIEGSYFDWTADGWHASVMSDMSFDREKIYVMASDYFSELWRNMMVLPFNMDMVNAAVAELGPILLPAGQSAPLAGESLSEYLFEMVLDGKWTYDVLIDMCEAIYVDEGTVGKEDINDRIGIYMDTYRGGPAASYLFSTSIQCLSDGVGTGSEGVEGGDLNGKYVILIPETGEAMNPVFEAVGELVNINGSMAGNMAGGVNTKAFAQGRAMSPGPMLLGELENEDLAEMTEVFSVVPLPLVTEGTVDNYNTYLHNAATLGGFNIYSTKYLAMSAYIQYVSENSAEIKDEYLQIVMKFKNTTFHLGTSQMLDLIYERVDSVRDMIIDTVVCRRKEKTTMKEAGGRNVTWGALLKNESYQIPTSVANGNAAFLDKYESFYSAKQQSLYELLVEWYALPSVPVPPAEEPPAETPAETPAE